MENLTPKNEPPTFRQAFLFWLKLGFISFGGPAGQIAVMQKECVERRGWIADDDFCTRSILSALARTRSAAVGDVSRLATSRHQRRHCVRRFVRRAVRVFLLILSYVYAAFGNLPQIGAVLHGFKAVVTAIVVEAVIKIAKKSFHSIWHLVIAVSAFAAIYFFQVPFRSSSSARQLSAFCF